MLDDNIKQQLTAHFDKIEHDIEIVASADEGKGSTDMLSMLEELAALSPKISLHESRDDNERKPSFNITRAGSDMHLRFAGIPSGHEFTSLVLALLQAGGHPVKASDSVIAQVENLDGEFHFETYISLSCQICPDVVQAINVMAVLNPNVHATMIDGAHFQDEVESRDVMAVPTIFLNGEAFHSGRISLEEIVNRIDDSAAERDAAEIDAKDPFDVLVVGGGPAGASAAIYAARKGIRTGVVADRFGGQVLDTAAIENFISVQETEGPKLATQLEQHVLSYEVDIMKPQTAAELVPGDLFEVKLDSGASLQSRSIILSTGARWRQMNVPGEEEYRNRGVAYCPHCDGPLYKGKHVAVIGGGNSGVEAAIDLAGIVSHVTLVEFEDSLRADAVLQSKLRSLGNATIITSAKTTEVVGDGKKVTGLKYLDRTNDEMHDIALEGVFVQIGLIPNTDWLNGVVDMTPRGEIITDEHGQTSIPGVFAAGDVTTVPYKQIVIAMGEGATASLGAFDYLIRKSAPVENAAEPEASETA
ncbi:alkyl hydroperoxide reductase subunit F [Salinisphaera sp. SPP-AMP-43]|uniref:alkyl hydroperoxide reductase subunit F n=1 Tax=Salinisphaera sp. SPP-AMP-43 TaxID=3121288 RepID=UPI003C6DFE26